MVAVGEDCTTDSSGACSAYLVASSKSGKHTWAFVLPGPVCNLNIVGESRHANRSQNRSGSVHGMKWYEFRNGSYRVAPLSVEWAGVGELRTLRMID